MSSLSQAEIDKIRRLRAEGLSYRNIAKMVNRPISLVYEVAKDVKPEEPEEDLLDLVNEKLETLWDFIKSCVENDLTILEILTDRGLVKLNKTDLNKFKEESLKELREAEKKLFGSS